MEELRRLNRIWLERTNPLRGLSIARATSMFDAARVWGSPRLQHAYNEIEATDPVLMTCVERRQAALSGLGYRFIASASEDRTLADEQRDALDKFVNGIDNFSELLEHMDLAFFRGFAHAQPIWEGGAVRHVSLLDSWNFLRNDAGEWLWNPACHETTGGLEPIGPDARLASLVRRRAIDYPALMIYIRHALGERDWGRFIERYAIPPVHFEMAPGAGDKDKPFYQEAGDAAHNGQNTIRPNGSRIDFAAEARGADPFTPFVDHQDRYIVLLATGGTLTSLAQADTGSLAGGAQMDVWREIVARDGVEIANALNRSLFRRYLEMQFPGRPVAARFELSNETKPTADEIADLAGKLKAAGYSIDQNELQEAVGFTLVKDETPAAQQPGFGGLPFMNKSKPEVEAEQGKEDPAVRLEPSTSPILAAFARDTGPAADAIKELLKNPSKEAAEKLLAGLDDLLPDDPATASIIAEEMAKAFGTVAASPSPTANKEGVCTSPNGPAGCKSPTCPGANDLSNLKNDQGEGLDEAQKASLLKGHTSIEQAIQNQADVMDAMNDPELGMIDFRWDAHGFGIKHIIERRNAFRDARDPNAISGEDMVRMIPSVIARGDRTFVGKGLRRDVEIDFKGLHIVLTPSLRGKKTNHWVMTGYDINPEAAGYRK